MSSIFVRSRSAGSAGKSSKPVTLYLIRLSPQCRAVWLYLSQNKIPYNLTDVEITLSSDTEQSNEENTTVSQGQKHDTDTVKDDTHETRLPAKCPPNSLPILVDGEVIVFGGHSVLRYLSSRYSCYAGYGNTLADRMLVESLLEWADTELHRILGYRCTYPQISSKYQLPSNIASEELIENGLEQLSSLLQFLEDTYLMKTSYLCGENLTIADSYICTTILQAEWIGFDLHLWPTLQKWMARVAGQPFWNDVHQAHNDFAEKLKRANDLLDEVA